MELLEAFRTTVESIKAWVNENKVDKTYHDNDVVIINDRIQSIEDQLYKKITLSFSAGVAEFGDTVTSTTLSWSTNKVPRALSLSGTNIKGEITDNTLTKYSVRDLSATSTSNEIWRLSVTDERGATVSKEARIAFLNGVYYGVSAAPSSYNRDFILALKKQLSSGKVPSFHVNANPGEYIYYCLPSSLGDCIFNLDGSSLNGGFSKVDTIQFFNQYNYEETYDIWMSDYAGLGNTDVKVS